MTRALFAQTWPSQIGRSLLALILAGIPFGSAFGQITLGRPFTDHMVIQRDRPIPFWGTAKPKAEVTIQDGDVLQSTKADASGYWSIELAARPADRVPFQLKVNSDGQSLFLSDLLAGDVWICAGQSNMEFPVSRSASAKEVLGAEEFLGLRLYQAEYTATGAGGQWTSRTLEGLAPDSFAKGKWSLCTQDTLPSMSAVAYYFGAALHERLDVPIGLVDLAAGGTPIEAWISRDALAASPATKNIAGPGNWLDNPALGDWCRERARQNLSRAIETTEAIPGDDLGPNHAFKPGFLWQTAVAPITRLPIRGVLWYQGESNAGSPSRVEQHAALFPLLISDWRRQWRDERLPFLFVQLPSMGRPYWPVFREQQRGFSSQIKHVGMAVTIDVGHPTDVHPRRKKPVGERLAALAMHIAYGGPQPSTGPLVQSARAKDVTVSLHFSNTGGGLTTSDGQPPIGFEILDATGASHAVRASIEGDFILLELPKDAKGVEARFAWAPVPGCNLVDGRGLPASPFRILIAD